MPIESSRRTSPTPIDQRRLEDGARAMALKDPKTKDEVQDHLEILHTGIVALQSMQDLGSSEANRAAHEDMRILEEKQRRLKSKLATL
jgi:hypothetical protein